MSQEEGELLPTTVEGDLSTTHGTRFPERVLQDVLKRGFEALQADPTLINDLFHRLDDDALKEIRDYYTTHKVTVRTNFPIDSLTTPLVSIMCASDDEATQLDVLDNFMGTSTDLAGTEYHNVHGHAVHSTFNIYCLAGKDANAALWLYYLVKALLLINLHTLHANGLANVVISGRDVSFRDDILPDLTYARMVSVTCDGYFSVRLTEKAARVLEYGAVFTEDAESGIKFPLVEEPE